ncbi:hypothetical protein SAMN02910384_00008 [Pseudobutyrivibrio sp. ACV-2]|uniref:hypothetical protein n=1 Tax=Pseudobutyrivibrio sp. ACV-2 TaxID=1520801 RepID=UPI0008944068|nr:hypothetical protein [Pseudobutyrivibrio sp. ACV-2]SDZ76452.1 hypothetical protein SAMN02910384_00008 [Pseudobutyrivibrio sp. ACV-2]
MAAIALYFGKVNLVSGEINGVIYNEISLRNILEQVSVALVDGISFKTEKPIKVDDEFKSEEIEYSLAIKEKNDSYVRGYIYKKSYIHYKDYNENTKDLDSKKIPNTEGVEFLYEYYREMIAYQRTQRFGYKEVLNAFEGIINCACTNNGLSYKFSIAQYTEGLELDQLKDYLIERPVQELNIKYQIPNPNSELLDSIRANREKTIEEFTAANLTTKSVIYHTNSKKGINIESEMIENELNHISSLHSEIDVSHALRNGYVVVEATDINGVKKSSADMRPLIKHIDESIDFMEAAHSTITASVEREIRKNQ